MLTIPEPELGDRVAEVLHLLSVPEESEITTRSLAGLLGWGALGARDRDVVLVELHAWPLGYAELVDIDGGPTK